MKRIFKIILVVIILSVFIGTIYFLYQKSQKKPRLFKTTKPIITNIIKKSVATGSVNPRIEIEIKPHISGIVDHIYLKSGQKLKKGDPIARIKIIPDMINLNNAENRLNKAIIGLEDAEKSYNIQNELYNKSMIDGILLKGTLNKNKDSYSMLKLSKAEFKVNNALLAIDDARKTFQRNQMLFNNALISETVLQESSLALKQAQEALVESENNFLLVKEDVTLDTQAQYQKAEVSLKKAREELVSARNNLQLIKDGFIKSSDNATNTIIKSTIDGMILDIPVKEGNLVIESNSNNAGTTVASVADMTAMIFEGNIDESEVGKLNTGMDLILAIGAIETEKFKATLEYISPKGKAVNGAIQFEIRANLQLKEAFFIRAGYSANADIVLEKRDQVLAINEATLIIEDDQTFVEVKQESRIFIKQPIKVGLSDGINIEVISGLNPDDQIKIQN